MQPLSQIPVASVFDLSPAEKLQLVQDLWDDLATNHADSIPISDELKAELLRREAKYRANPDSGLSWEEVKRNVLNHYGR